MTFVYADIAKMLSSTDAIAHTVVVTKPLSLQFAEARVKRLLLLVFVGPMDAMGLPLLDFIGPCNKDDCRLPVTAVAGEHPNCWLPTMYW